MLTPRLSLPKLHRPSQVVTARLELPRPHAAQARVIAEAVRFNVVDCGRRWGKTILGEDRLIQPALAGFPVAWFSPTYKMLSDVWRDVRTTLFPVTDRVSAQEHRLELKTRGTVDMWSLDTPNAARGRKYKRIIVDEAAIVPGLQEAWQQVIRPTLTDLLGDAWFLSTPKGFNDFKALFDLGQDPTRDDWRSWQMPTSANPYIRPEEIEAARQDMTEAAYAQEYLAQFINWEGSVFRHIMEAATAQAQEEPIAGHQYVIGIDWGRSVDYTVFCCIDATAKQQVFQDRSNRVDYAVQRARLHALCQHWQPAVIIAEANSMGQPIIEQLWRDGLPVHPFTTTNATKAQAIEALALALERGELTILNDPVLVAELHSYEGKPLPSGMIRYGAQEGQHDDCVMALALAWLVITESEHSEPEETVYLDPYTGRLTTEEPEPLRISPF